MPTLTTTNPIAIRFSSNQSSQFASHSKPSPQTQAAPRTPSPPAQHNTSSSSAHLQTDEPPAPSANVESPPSTASFTKKFRAVILTGAVAFAVVVGAITGVQLKTDREQASAGQKIRETPIEDQIAALKEQRARLVALKTPLEKSLESLRARMAEKLKNEEKGEGKGP